MSESWHAFAFGAFDPSATITLDKLAGFLIPQALSARIFGFHTWSIALPQVVEGMVTVVATWLAGSRWRDDLTGILAAAAVATTPLFAAMFGSPMEDSLLTMSLALAFICWQSAVRSGRMSSLLFAAMWVAIGFQAKMMAAWLILPALAIGYLVGAPHPFRQRVVRVLLAGLVALVLSLSWMTAIQLVPAKDRPYIDGSLDNSTYSMVFVFNGLNRIAPNLIPGAQVSAPPPTVATFANMAMVTIGDGVRTDKLIAIGYLTQIGWLYPLALGGIVLSALELRRRRKSTAAPDPDDGRRNSHRPHVMVLTLTIWLVTNALMLTVMKIPHTTYLSSIGFQVAVLSAIGVVEAARWYRGGRGHAGLIIPALMVTETLWTLMILVKFEQSPTALTPVVAVLGFGASISLVIAARNPSVRWVIRPAFVTCLIAIFLAPAVWTMWTITRSDTGTASDAYAGPRFSAIQGAPKSLLKKQQAFELGVPFRPADITHLKTAQSSLATWLAQRQGASGPLLTTETWGLAAPFILDAGLDVLPIGGYSTDAPTPTLPGFSASVAAGTVRYVLLAGPGSNGGWGTYSAPASQSAKIAAWVRTHCGPVTDSPLLRQHSDKPTHELFLCSPSEQAAAVR